MISFHFFFNIYITSILHFYFQVSEVVFGWNWSGHLKTMSTKFTNRWTETDKRNEWGYFSFWLRWVKSQRTLIALHLYINANLHQPKNCTIINVENMHSSMKLILLNAALFHRTDFKNIDNYNSLHHFMLNKYNWTRM